MRWKLMWGMANETVNAFLEDKAFRLGAALAYYSIFSIAPLLIIVIAVAGFFMGETAVRQQIVQQLHEFIGEQGTSAIESMVGAHKPGTSLLTTAVGLVVLLFGASGVFGQLQDALNAIWGVQPKPGRGVATFIRSRFLSFTMVLGIGFLLLISMVISAVLSALTGAIGNFLPMPVWVAHLVNVAASFIVTSLLFGMIFKVLPDARVRWRDVWVGALFTALLFTAGKFLLGFYLGLATTTSSYGAAGSLVVVLIWIYYSSLILFFGAEFTKIYAKKRGAGIVPTPDAVPVTPEARAEQGMPKKPELAYAQAEQALRKMRSRVSETTTSRGKAPKNSGEIIRARRWPYLSLGVGLGLATGWMLKGDAAGHRGFFRHQRHRNGRHA